jgi:hypothetical protein
MTDISKFAESVQQMRTAQSEYFRTRSSIALQKSKRLEKEVDDMARVYAKSAPISQADLFGKSIPVVDPEFKHETKFCLLNDFVMNDHGRFVYHSDNGVHSIAMPEVLSEYRDFLFQQGITKDFQRA